MSNMRAENYESNFHGTTITYKDVVIIGNGPGGLTASFVLSGNRPVYNGLGHPDPMLSARLASLSPAESILSADKLSFLSQGMEDLGGTSSIGTLFDSLMHPGSLMGLKRDSPISWVPAAAIDHVVLGVGPPGGIWQRLDPELLTLSLNSWMELPGLRMDCDSQRRAKAREVAHYYSRYVQEKGLAKYQRECKVISVKLLDKEETSRARWQTVAVDANGNRQVYISRFCILATGSSVAKRLNVDGEADGNVVHDLLALESKLPPYVGCQPCRVLIVGAGLSAADAVIIARFHGCDVVHSFRTDDVTLGHMLPESLYPEYHKVREMMRSAGGYPGYTPVPGSIVKKLSNGCAVLEMARERGKEREMARERSKEREMARERGKEVSYDFDIAAVLIGSSADLSFLQSYRSGLELTTKGDSDEINPKANPIAVERWSYQASHALNHGLYAVGSIAGDIYVRYIPGGGVAAAGDIIHRLRHS